LNTPIRRLDGIAYWVIEDTDAIHDFINTQIRREWEEDIIHMPVDPARGAWLSTLNQREWKLEIVRIEELITDPAAMNFIDPETGYNFAEHLAQRRKGLREGIEKYGVVIWPIILRKEDMQVLDGYCRYTALKEIGVSRLYAYVGFLRASI
jgi:hypothetical protein